MGFRILILGASYGSLLGTKLAMAGHDVTLICRQVTADLINKEGTEVRIKLRGEDAHRAIRSADLPGRVDAATPAAVDVSGYDLVGLAMQEPQYRSDEIRDLLKRVATARIPCLSIMNMPPLPYLKRIPGLDAEALRSAFVCPEVWDAFDPELVTLCSPDPQAFRPPEEGANVLHVGLPTNFKAAGFSDLSYNAMLTQMQDDISGVTLDGKDVPVKLRVFDSLFVPLAKWSMLLTGNYRCVQSQGVRPIREAVHSDLDASAAIYAHVDTIAAKLGADPADQVPFAKYAKAAENLLKPSSVARAIDGGTAHVERVDRLVQRLSHSLDMPLAQIDETVSIVDARLAANASQMAA